MNWLLYIGGGIIFVGVFYGIMSVGDPEEKDLKPNHKHAQHLRIVSLTMIWIWICWRFIR